MAFFFAVLFYFSLVSVYICVHLVDVSGGDDSSCETRVMVVVL